MSETIVLDIDLDDADPNGIFLIATVSGAEVVVLDGALVSGTVATMDFARKIAFDSVGNDSGMTFTVVGTDQDGKALTEVVTGGNATLAESAGYFKTVTSITTSAGTAADVTIGTVDEASARTVPLNSRSDSGATVNVNVTGTIDYTVQERFDDIQASNTAVQTNNWQTVAAFSAKTADVTSGLSAGASAARIIINSHSTGAELQMYVAQPSYGA